MSPAVYVVRALLENAIVHLLPSRVLFLPRVSFVLIQLHRLFSVAWQCNESTPRVFFQPIAEANEGFLCAACLSISYSRIESRLIKPRSCSSCNLTARPLIAWLSVASCILPSPECPRSWFCFSTPIHGNLLSSARANHSKLTRRPR